MAACIAQIKKVEAETKQHGTVPRSCNKISEDLDSALAVCLSG